MVDVASVRPWRSGRPRSATRNASTAATSATPAIGTVVAAGAADGHALRPVGPPTTGSVATGRLAVLGELRRSEKKIMLKKHCLRTKTALEDSCMGVQRT